MVLINGEYLAEEVTEEQVKWAMHLSVLALQGAANHQDWEAYCNKVAEGTMHLIGTLNMIKDELDL